MGLGTLFRFLRIDTCSRNEVGDDHCISTHPEKLDVWDCLEPQIYSISTLEFVRHTEISSASVPITESYERRNFLFSVVDMWLYFFFQAIGSSSWGSRNRKCAGESHAFWLRWSSDYSVETSLTSICGERKGLVDKNSWKIKLKNIFTASLHHLEIKVEQDTL